MRRLRVLSVMWWVIAVALGLFGIGRIAYAVVTTPFVPMNRAALSLDGAPVHPASVQCSWLSALFADGATLWRFPCVAEGSATPVVLAIDLARGTGQVWPLPEADRAYVAAGSITLNSAGFARHDDGRRALLYVDNPTIGRGGHQDNVVYLILDTATGAMTPLPPPADAALNVRGLDWDGDQPVVVAQRWDGTRPDAPLRYRYADGAWEARALPVPGGCAVCALQLAYREDGAWRALWLDVPPAQLRTARPWRSAPSLLPGIMPMTSVYLTDADGARLPLTLPGNRARQADAASLFFFDGLFDPTPANLYRYTEAFTQEYDLQIGSDTAVEYRYDGGAWQALRLPAALADDGYSVVVPEPAQLHLGVQAVRGSALPFLLSGYVDAMPATAILPSGTGRPAKFLYVGEAGGLLVDSRREADRGQVVTIRRVGAVPLAGVGDATPPDGVRLSAAYDLHLLPLPEAGQWLAFDTREVSYLRLDARFNRLDAPSPVEHLLRELEGGGPDVTVTAALVMLIGTPVLLALLGVHRRVFRSWGRGVVPLIFIVVALLSEGYLTWFVERF